MFKKLSLRNILRFTGSIFIIMSLLANTNQKVPRENQQSVNQTKDNKIELYSYPSEIAASTTYKLSANNQEVFVYSTSAGPFAAFGTDGPVMVDIDMPVVSKNVSISPAKYGLVPEINGNHLRFLLPGPMLVVVEVDGMPQLYIYANPPEKKIPYTGLSNVKYYKAGQVYDAGEIRLKSNETLYIEGGAVVRGCIRATSGKNIRVAGNGILDGSYYRKGNESRRSIVFEDCQNSIIENIIMVEPSSWMIVLGVCKDVIVRDVKELGSLGSTDGADIVGSRNIRIENCFFRNGDDCIAIKSLDLSSHGKDATLDFSKDVEDIEIIGCSFLSYIGGQALEIGHELRTGSVKNIRFINCDILGVHGFGGVFGIHNSDRATVSNVLYENIRVEHHYDKLIDIKIIKSRWSKDMERGQIHDIVFRNIDVAISIYNPGYSCSLIGGYDADHIIENILFDNFRVDGMKVLNPDQMDLYSKQAKNITFK